MNKKRKRRLANKILANEAIIDDENSLGKSVQSAKAEIENIIESLTLKEFFELDDFIVEQRCKG